MNKNMVVTTSKMLLAIDFLFCIIRGDVNEAVKIRKTFAGNQKIFVKNML
jgi:hypothetical protein